MDNDLDLDDLLVTRLREAQRVAADQSMPVEKRIGRLRYLLGWLDGYSSDHASQTTRAACYYVGQVIRNKMEALTDGEEVKQ